MQEKLQSVLYYIIISIYFYRSSIYPLFLTFGGKMLKVAFEWEWHVKHLFAGQNTQQGGWVPFILRHCCASPHTITNIFYCFLRFILHKNELCLFLEWSLNFCYKKDHPNVSIFLFNPVWRVLFNCLSVKSRIFCCKLDK